jgi:hypothetical protein
MNIIKITLQTSFQFPGTIILIFRLIYNLNLSVLRQFRRIGKTGALKKGKIHARSTCKLNIFFISASGKYPHI